MTDVRFHRAKQAVISGLAANTEDRAQRAAFDQIADGGAGAMGFGILDFMRRHPCESAGRGNEFLLGATARHRHPGRPPVLIDRGAADDGIDGVSVRERGRERLQAHRTHAFTPHEAVGAGIKRFAAPIRRQHAHAGERDEGEGGDDAVHTGGDGACAFLVPQRLAGHVHRHHGGGAGRVHCHAGALEI